MSRSLLSLSMIVAGFTATAQTTVHQVLVLNEGHYDYTNQVQTVPVSLGSYDPSTGVYTDQVTIADARFGNDVEVTDETIYVGADSFLLKYDANSFALLDEEIVRGIRHLAIWNDQLLITRGESGGLPHYFEVRDRNTLDLLYAITPADGLPYSCEAVEVIGDKAYLCANNSFDWPNYTSLIGIVDLVAESYGPEIDLGPDGLNPEQLMFHGGSLYSFNSKDYNGGSISKVDPVAGTLQYTNNVALNSGCGATTAAANRFYYLEYSVNQLARYDLGIDQVLDTLTNGIAAYGVIGDPINNVIYMTTTDYISTGTLYVTENDGTLLDSVAIGVAAGKMALDLRTSTAVNDASGTSIQLLPNPAVDLLTVQGVSVGAAYDVIDTSGRVALSGALTNEHRVNVGALKSGNYTMRLTTATGSTVLPFVKQ